jgi:hypothetical protein
MRTILAVVVMLLGSAAARACPVCDTETGQQVRAGIFGEDFGSNLLVTALPFPVLLLIVALIHLGGTGRKTPPPEAATNGEGNP